MPDLTVSVATGNPISVSVSGNGAATATVSSGGTATVTVAGTSSLVGAGKVIVSSGGLADLTSQQQAQITQGVVVVTTDGYRWVFSGVGSVTNQANYVQLADITPEWGAISGKPSTFAPSAHKSSHSTGGSDALSPSDIGAAAASHSHGSITSDGKLGTTSGQIVVTGAGGALTTAATIDVSKVTAYTGTNNQFEPLTDGDVLEFLARAMDDGLSSAIGFYYSYTLPNATASTLGGVIVGAGLGVSSGTVSVTYGTTSGTACQGNDARLVSDGNKGDITVASGNTSWTINAGAVITADIADGAVTNAKVASITASKISDFASAVAAASPEEVVEYLTTADFPASGNSTLLYIATDASRAYRWTGSQYVEVGSASAFVQTHTHAAGDVTSGVFATARLGSGTANSTTFLRGDQTYAAPPVTSVDGATGAVTVSKAAVFEFTRSSKPAAATGSNGSYTWSLPAGAKFIEVFCLGPGGGGGSGRRGAAGTARFGGGGGAGGNVTVATVDAAVITTALTINVAAGGVGGAAVSIDDTNGNNGTGGSNSSVSFNGSQTIRGIPGAAGSGGTAAAGAAGGVNATDQRTFAASAGGASSVSASGGSTFPAAGNAGMGGPAGGGISASNVAYSGGQQWNPPSLAGVINSGVTNVLGGAASTTAEGAAGASGVSYGYGGAGGGASANGFNSGAGGNGGEGYVRITVWS